MNQNTQNIEGHRRTARVLANAQPEELALLWNAWPNQPEIEYVRGPEAGLVMVQGRTGGSGDRFNLGEATITRATVRARTPEGESIGTAYVLGSSTEHAGLAAIFDAMLNSAQRADVLGAVIDPLEYQQRTRDAERIADARATVVDFFTVARENDGDYDDDAFDDAKFDGAGSQSAGPQSSEGESQ